MSWKPAPWLSAAGVSPSFGTAKPRNRIRPISKARANIGRKYTEARRKWIEGKRCAVYPNRRADQVHHIRGRVGDLLLDQRYWLAVSHAGHRWIHENPDAARARGWLAQRGEWGKAEA